MKYEIVLDDKEIKKSLRGLGKQIPFATAVALTNTAKDVRNHLVKRTWRRQVNVRSRAFMGRAMRFIRADKRRLEAWVHVDSSRISPGGAKAINRLIKGKPHYPFSSQYLAVPVGKGILTAAGRLSKRGRAALDRNNPDTFVADLRGMGPAIWQRVGRGRKSLKLLFVLKPRVPTPRKFSFEKSARRAARKVWPRHIRAAVRRAIRTAF